MNRDCLRSKVVDNLNMLLIHEWKYEEEVCCILHALRHLYSASDTAVDALFLEMQAGKLAGVVVEIKPRQECEVRGVNDRVWSCVYRNEEPLVVGDYVTLHDMSGHTGVTTLARKTICKACCANERK